ncbi:MAG TPA: SDR family oxidoreductase [Thermoplasmata archaeon]|nr:SDR family oxidoreductase [Thermoplasmata archaeon]
MKVFVTGASGFIGSAVVRELVQEGYSVTGLARSDESAKALVAAGAQVHRGDLEDLESLKRGAAASEGVIHTGFIHEFARFKEVCEIDRRAIGALGSVLVGTDRPLVVTSGTAMVAPGRLATESDVPTLNSSQMPRVATDEAVVFVLSRGVRAIEVRNPPSVHGEGDHGFVPTLINVAREKGVSAYVGDGANRWPAVHRLDSAHLYRLALEKGSRGSRYHAVAEEGITLKKIAQAIGEHLGVPAASKTHEEATQHFGWFAPFVSLDCPASSERTRAQLGWSASRPTLLQDLEHGSYFGH